MSSSAATARGSAAMTLLPVAVRMQHSMAVRAVCGVVQQVVHNDHNQKTDAGLANTTANFILFIIFYFF
jgi:hypothetical protein